MASWSHRIIQAGRDFTTSLHAPVQNRVRAARSYLLAESFIWLALENLSGQDVLPHLQLLSPVSHRLRPGWIQLPVLNSLLPAEAQTCPESSHFLQKKKLGHRQIHFAKCICGFAVCHKSNTNNAVKVIRENFFLLCFWRKKNPNKPKEN